MEIGQLTTDQNKNPGELRKDDPACKSDIKCEIALAR